MNFIATHEENCTFGKAREGMVDVTVHVIVPKDQQQPFPILHQLLVTNTYLFENHMSSWPLRQYRKLLSELIMKGFVWP